MKRKFFFLLALVMMFSFSNKFFAQNKATTTYVTIKDMHYPAVAIQLDVAADIVRVALEEEFKHHGLKGKNSGNLRIYENVVFSPISKNVMSYYTLVEKINSTSSTIESSRICFVAMNVDPIRFVDESTNPAVCNNIKTYLEKFALSAKQMCLEVQLNDQFKSIERLERRITSLTNDSMNIQRRKNDLDLKAKEVEKNLNIQRTTLNSQKAILEELYKQRQNKQ